MHWDFILMLLLLAVAVPLLGWRRIRELMRAPETSKSDRIRLYASTILSQWLAVGFILWRTRAHAISDAQLGMAIPNALLTAATSIVLGALILANQLFSLRQLSVHPEAAEGALAQIALRIFPQGGSERLIFVAVVATVAVCEEVIYRGFVQWALQDWARGMLLAGILGSAALFGLGHVYQGWRGFTTTCIVGILFSVSRSWTGSLLPGIFAHFIADLTVSLFAPSRLRAVSGNRLSVEIPQGRDSGT
jgi:CAAX protease family protein